MARPHRGPRPAYDSIESGYDTPNMGVFAISLGMVAPTIFAHATPEVQDLYLRDLYRGDLVGCQLFPVDRRPTSHRCRPTRTATATSRS